MEDITFEDDVKVIFEAEHIAVIESPQVEDLLAVIHIDDQEEPVEGADPSQYGYVTLRVNYIDAPIAIVSVLSLSNLLSMTGGLNAVIDG